MQNQYCVYYTRLWLWLCVFFFFLLSQPTEMTTFKFHTSMERFELVTQAAGVEMSLKTSLNVSLCDLTEMSFLVSLFQIFLHVLYLTLQSD